MENDNMINCGLIMPLAPMPGYSINQFNDVQSILLNTIRSIDAFNFNPRMVSESKGEVDIIHNNIVNNIYDDPIVVVDISGRNGNVMLELGLRLAFDKPLVIIKDDKTDYMFDISMIEHISYPSDLRHTEIVKFQQILKEKIVNTYKKSIEDINYSPFLNNFKRIKVKSIDDIDISESETLQLILGKLDEINMTQKLEIINSNSIEWQVGDTAFHKKWGAGKVIKVEGTANNQEVDINFKDLGTKRLLSEFAPITKIS
ncbi:hypothetical protein I6N95_25630 [Vagococcus sp. BWB3-3]|uniref:Uncharacterized protein n=1 Tax=Vagococcus allomyrinae TaxID=2794353 RepID=A0A940PGF2_9ENTE|nr:hypothetical protein [Vagococcus allomyrinae]MBP1044394.1 hypothetical protein [Vagococcus allomyrinae]